jgi:hypothetical protein
VLYYNYVTLTLLSCVLAEIRLLKNIYNARALLWCDDHDGNQALYYRFSLDGSESWSTETKLSECVAPAGYLSAHLLIITGQYIHIAFNDDRTGENEIYYKRGIISIN